MIINTFDNGGKYGVNDEDINNALICNDANFGVVMVILMIINMVTS